jgi:hypothetical protein
MRATGGGASELVEAHVVSFAAAICATNTPLEVAIQELRDAVALGESVKTRMARTSTKSRTSGKARKQIKRKVGGKR